MIRRIMQDYGAGVSPRKIAFKLNAEGVGAPRGGTWSASTINGNRTRGTGILNNEAHIGRLVWNRLRYQKDPQSGQRRSRANLESSIVVVSAPELRIVPVELWNRVKARQAALDTQTDGVSTRRTAFRSIQRPRYLFSGLMRCGMCGGGFSKISQQHFGCSTARNKGPIACTNRRSIRHDTLGETVLGALRERLMDPPLFKAFAAAFTAEWNKMQNGTLAEQTARTS
ncbi:MAG: recombinase family protein, partial [Rhodopila sp.]